MQFGHVECQVLERQDILVEMLRILKEMKFGVKDRSTVVDLDLGLFDIQVEDELEGV